MKGSLRCLAMRSLIVLSPASRCLFACGWRWRPSLLPPRPPRSRPRRTPPPGPEYPREEIHDTFVGADEAITKLRIANCRWPDCYSNESAVRDIFRLEGVDADAWKAAANRPDGSLGQAQALALLKWVCILVSTKGGGYVHEIDKSGREVYVYDPHVILTAYGHHYCDGIGWVLVQLWRASGQMGLDKCHHGHSFPSLRYRDADGHWRYHDLEPEFRSYYWDESRSIIGTATMPLLRGHVHRHLVQPQRAHTLRTSLREGETLRLLWDNEGYVIQPGKQPPVIALRPEFAYRPGRTDGVYGAVGQATQILEPDLRPGRYASAVLSSENVACADVPAGGARLHPAEKGKPGHVVYRLPSAFVAVDGVVEATLVKGRAADVCRLMLSRDDGRSWQEIVSHSEAGAGQVKVNIGLEARAGGRPHVYTAYDVLLKAEFSSDADPRAVGLGALRVTVWRQLSKRALPNLMPGENVFRVTADRIAAGKALNLNIEYSVDGAPKTAQYTIGSVPFYFTIDTGDVREEWPTNFDEAFNVGRIRMKSIVAQVVDAGAVPASTSLPAEACEAKFRRSWPHPADRILKKLPVKQPERDPAQTGGFFPQSSEVKRDRKTMEALIVKLKTGQGVEPWVAAEELGAYPEAIDALLEVLPTADIDLLVHLCKAFAQIKDKRVAAPLLKIWAEWHRHMPGSRYIPDVLAALGDRSVVPDLIKPLRQMRFDMRFHVIHALGRLGGPEAEAALRELALHDPFPANRELAREMLEGLRR